MLRLLTRSHKASFCLWTTPDALVGDKCASPFSQIAAPFTSFGNSTGGASSLFHSCNPYSMWGVTRAAFGSAFTSVQFVKSHMVGQGGWIDGQYVTTNSLIDAVLSLRSILCRVVGAFPVPFFIQYFRKSKRSLSKGFCASELYKYYVGQMFVSFAFETSEKGSQRVGTVSQETGSDVRGGWAFV